MCGKREISQQTAYLVKDLVKEKTMKERRKYT